MLPRDCFRTGCRLGLIAQDRRRWLALVEDRNRTAHLYDDAEEAACEVYRALPAYLDLLRGLLARLREAEAPAKQDESPSGGI